MIKRILAFIFLGIICLVLFACSSKNEVSYRWEGHTTPDKWEKARVFHTPIVRDSRDWQLVKDRISISRVKPAGDYQKTVFSPHKVYWFLTHEDSLESEYFKSTFTITIFNERDYLIQLSLKGIYKNWAKKVSWINEKLLYVQVWWGRVLGTYLIFDVEKEIIVYKEMVHDGGIPFLQWQQSKISNLFPQAYVLQCTQTVHCERISGPAG